jgi:hypothetical protein
MFLSLCGIRPDAGSADIFTIITHAWYFSNWKGSPTFHVGEYGSRRPIIGGAAATKNPRIVRIPTS